MCRFVLYQGPPLTLASLVIDPANSIINQSLRARESDDAINGDGFGVAWYVPELSEEAGVFKSFTPAWSNLNLIHLARVTRSRCVMAHVRAATPGLTVSELDCHPFTRGRFSFMHNGDVGGFSHIRRAIQQRLSDRAFASIQGSTDSVHLFALFLDHMWHSHIADPLEAMAASLMRAVHDVQALQEAHHLREFNYLNIAVSDGTQSVALRYTTDDPRHASSLYVHTGRKYVCDGNICRMVDPEKGQGAVLISSEPLSDDPGWDTVPVNHLVKVSKEQTVEIVEARLR